MRVLLLAVAICISSQVAVLASEDKKSANDAATSEQEPPQSKDPADLKLTADIRKSLKEEADLSPAARKVKVTASGGRVWLRGIVKTQREKQRIRLIAITHAEAGNVEDLLEVAP